MESASIYCTSHNGGMRKKHLSSQTLLNEDNSSENEGAAPQPRRGVGRRGRRSNEEKGDGRGRRGKKQKEEKQQEWVQCEKCEKWRRLPRHIAAKSLPDSWFCSMNTWDPRSASCAILEDQYPPEDKPQTEFPISPKPPNKRLSYKTLIRRPTRPISERTRAAESIFSSHMAEAEDEQSGAPPVVLYANSSMFQQKVSYHRMAEQQEQIQRNEERIPLFTLMNNSKLWKDLSSGFNPGNFALSLVSSSPNSTTTILKNTLSPSMKNMVYYALGNNQLSASDILLECQCREWDHNKWKDLRASVTYESVCTTMKELVKDGLVETVDPTGDGADNAFGMICYKRTANIGAELEMVKRRNTDIQNRCGSRCMKLSKPWKKKARLE